MRAAFSLSFAVDGLVFDLKAFPTLDESQTEIKRTTAFKDVLTGAVSDKKAPKKVTAEDAKIERVSVSKSTGEVVSDDQVVKGIWGEDGFVEISDESLSELRMSNGEFRVIGTAEDVAVETKGSSYALMPAKSTKEARARFAGLREAMQHSEENMIFIEGSVRNKQRLYVMFANSHSDVVYLQEVAYAEEMLDVEDVYGTLSEDIEPEDIYLSIPRAYEVPSSGYITAFNDNYGDALSRDGVS